MNTRRGLTGFVSFDRSPPHAELECERELDFAGVLAALHELVSDEVMVWIGGPQTGSRRSPLVIRGRLERAFELGESLECPVVAEIGSATLMLEERTVEYGWRDVFRRRSDDERWIVLFIAFRDGGSIELEQTLGT